jgi:deoxyuridine 5'-triphosphate nucleotidohydrolase
MNFTRNYYLLGLNLTGGCIQNPNESEIFKFALRSELLTDVQKLLSKQFNLDDNNTPNNTTVINNKEFSDFFCKNVTINEAVDKSRWHILKSQNLTLHFQFESQDTRSIKTVLLKGLFEGSFWFDDQKMSGGFEHWSLELLNWCKDTLKSVFNVSTHIQKNKIVLDGINLLDVLDQFENLEWSTNKEMKECYKKLCAWSLKEKGTFYYKKVKENAVTPFKSRASDSGWDLTILEKVKTVNGVEYYDTGMIVEPPFGYYFDLVPRSSLSKTGYMLANSVGIIDRGYRSSILVPLIKVSHSAPELQLPFRAVQMIPRHIIHLNSQEVSEFSETSRNQGGFGSTGDTAFSK